MARKTLKQKLRQQVRSLKLASALEHEKAGLVINYETQAMQAVAMAHGVMATLISAKNLFDQKSDEYKTLEQECQHRISQCIHTLMSMGISMEEANFRIKRGH